MRYRIGDGESCALGRLDPRNLELEEELGGFHLGEECTSTSVTLKIHGLSEGMKLFTEHTRTRTPASTAR